MFFPCMHFNLFAQSVDLFGLYVLLFFHIGSMYGIFSYIWLICMVNVGKYTIH